MVFKKNLKEFNCCLRHHTDETLKKFNRVDGKFIRYRNTAPIYQSLNNKLKLIHPVYEIRCIPIDMKYIVEDVNENDDITLIKAIWEQMISDSILSKMYQKHIPIGGSNIYVD